MTSRAARVDSGLDEEFSIEQHERGLPDGTVAKTLPFHPSSSAAPPVTSGAIPMPLHTFVVFHPFIPGAPRDDDHTAVAVPGV